MWRLAFLLLVIVGALAVILAMLVGAGTWRAVQLQSAGRSVTPPPAGPPVTQPTPMTAARPAVAASAKLPPLPVPPADSGDLSAEDPPPAAADRQPLRPAPPILAAPLLPALPPPIVEREHPSREALPPPPRLVPRDPVMGRGARRLPAGAAAPREWPPPPRLLAADPDAPPIELLAAAGRIRGDGLRIEGDGAKAAVNWRDQRDGLEWTVDVPRTAVYAIEVEYACDPREGGGAYWVIVDNGQRVTAEAKPTRGWDDYRRVRAGVAYVPAGKVDVVLRTAALPRGRALMNLRAVRLVPER